MKNFVFLSALIFLFISQSSAQVTIGFQGGETGNTWGFTSTGANSTAQNESLLAPNKVTGAASLVVGGNTAGGSCISGGSGNGLDVLRNFTFEALDISSSSNFSRTLTFSYGTRFPTCVGTGWDSNEDLIFTPYYDGIAQTPVTIVAGNNNAAFSISTHEFTWTVPSCVNEFHFEVGITTNRRDELLFIDDVKLTAPSLNTPVPTLSAISGTAAVCTGSTQNLSISPVSNVILTWSGIPSGASFTSPNNTSTSTSMGINWGTAVAGTYTISVTPYQDICGVSTAGNPSTIQITLADMQITATGSTSICPGQSTQISASGATDYTWDNGLGAGQSFTVSPTTTTTYTVTGSSGSCNAVASVTVTVSNGPVINVVASPNTICSGSSSTLTASGTTGYSWSPATGLSSTTGATVIATPLTTTTYTVVGSTGNCSSTSSVTITVSSSLVVAITASSDTVCAGNVTTLTASGATTYTWLPTAGLNATNGATVTATPSTSTTYSVTGTSNGCQGTASILISVENPIVNAGNDITVCAGNPVTLNATGANTYVWDNGAANGVSFIPTSTQTYTVTGNLVNGCSATDQLLVTVESSPTVLFSSNIQTGCLPLQVQFTHSATGGNSFQWNFGDGTFSTDANPEHTFYSSGCKDISLEVNSANGCTSNLMLEDYICSQANPTASFIVNPSEVSETNPLANFINTSENSTSWLWNFGDQSTSIQESPSHIFSDGQDHYVITLYAYNAEGCMDSTQAILPFEESTIYYVPNTFTPDGNELNQTFQPVFTTGFDPTRYNLEIYNRWGERLFESSDYEMGWDGSYNGTLLPDGAYIWKIGYNLKNSDDRKILTGHVNLVR